MNSSEGTGRKPARWSEMGKGLGVVGALVVLMMWLAGAFVDKVQPGPPVPKPQAEPVSVWKVERKRFPQMVDQVGTVRSRTEAQVASRIMAQVKDIPVREGDTVSGGEGDPSAATVLARLEDSDIKARLRQAEAQVETLERGLEAARAKLGAMRAQLEAAKANRERAVADFKRYQDLYRNQAATGQQMEQARAQRDVAEANVLAAAREVQATESDIKRMEAQSEQAAAAVAEARATLDYSVIRAPFGGKLIRKLVDVGDMASPGQPLFVIETSSQLELQAFLSESLLPRVQLGQELEVQVDALDRSFRGRLREIVPQSDPTTRTVLVKVTLPQDPELVNGLFGRLAIPWGSYETLVVPRSAVRYVGQLTLVEVRAVDGHTRRRLVTLGREHGDWVEVLSGLQENEEVVLP